MSRNEVNIGLSSNEEKTPLQKWVQERVSQENLLKRIRSKSPNGNELGETSFYLVEGEILLLQQKPTRDTSGFFDDFTELLTIGDKHEAELVNEGLLEPIETLTSPVSPL